MKLGRILVPVGIAAVLPLGLATPAEAAAPNWDKLIECESGNRNVNNSTYPKSSASGYFQIIDGTWRRYGGTQFASRAIHATRDQQTTVASRIHAKNGLRDWDASRSCWQGKMSAGAPRSIAKAQPAAKARAARVEVKPPAKRNASQAATYTVKRGDTLSTIASRTGTSWEKLYQKNKGQIRNPNMIYVNQVLSV